MKETKKLFKKTITSILADQGTDEVLSEAALPAYAHKNPIIDFIFWKRLEVVKEHLIKNLDKNASVLDFGCGTGVLSFELAKQGYTITSIDLDLTPVNILKEHIKYPDNINFLQDDIFNIDFEANKFDCIIALDVLEHIPIDKLPEFLAKFDYLLKKSGTVIVSGPTENFLYKLGRKLAGNDFTGHYHETTIGKIKEVFSKRYKVITLKKLIWPLTLFEIFYVNKS